jgi:hypothetical protein
LYEGPATITRFNGSKVAVEVAVWVYDAGPASEWGGRVVVNAPETQSDDVGTTCSIRWPTPGGAMVGAFILGAGQVSDKTATYRMHGSGQLAKIAADV